MRRGAVAGIGPQIPPANNQAPRVWRRTVALTGGSLVAVACLASWLQQRFLSRYGEGAGVYVLSVLAAALAYWTAGLIPFIGVLLILLAFVAGTGGLILVAVRVYKQPAEAQPTPP